MKDFKPDWLSFFKRTSERQYFFTLSKKKYKKEISWIREQNYIV